MLSAVPAELDTFSEGERLIIMEGNALGFVEARGYTGMVEASDAMVKAARVEFIRKEKIGGAYITSIVQGDVGAARASVEAGKLASQRVGEFIVGHVIPSPHDEIIEVLVNRKKPDIDATLLSEALGLIETRGWVTMVEAADAACKAAKVRLMDYVYTGSGYTCAVFKGEVAAIKASIEAGSLAGGRIGELVTVHLIARPHTGLLDVLPVGGKVKFGA